MFNCTHSAFLGVKMHRSHAELIGTWAFMMRRCYDESFAYFADYGGRGITVCERWHDFRNFAEDMAPRPEGLTLDRENNDLGYSKENCRWANAQQQAANRRNSIHLTIDGETRIVAEWARISGVHPQTIVNRHRSGYSDRDAVFGKDARFSENSNSRKRYDLNGEQLTVAQLAKRAGLPDQVVRQRVKYGWPIGEVMSATMHRNRKSLTHAGETLSIPEWAIRTGIPQNHIRNRLNLGWSIERALTYPVTKSRKPLASLQSVSQ